MKRSFIFLYSLLLIMFCTPILKAEDKTISAFKIDEKRYAALYDIISATGSSLSFDPVSKRGKLLLKEHVAIFMEECSVMIIDGHIFRSSYPVTRYNNETLIPSKLFTNIIEAFIPDASVALKNNDYILTKNISTATIKTKSEDTSTKITEIKPNSAAADKIGFIIIDAGHGGKDPGAVAKGKIYEKTITLAVAKQIGTLIKKKNPAIKVYYTRNTDKFIELGERTEFANRKLTNETGGIFVSIHVNASIIPKMNGFESYFLSQNPTNEDARSTAALENNVIVLENPGRRKSYDEVEYIEALMLTTQIQKESSNLAEEIQSVMSKELKESNSRGVKTADFFVLRGSLMPAVLVEIGYITNDKERSRLLKKDYQAKIAGSITNGISRFLSKSNRSNGK